MDFLDFVILKDFFSKNSFCIFLLFRIRERKPQGKFSALSQNLKSAREIIVPIGGFQADAAKIFACGPDIDS